jgi:hypothetical protein
MNGIDPLARALRELRASPPTEAAGHQDAEDAEALRSILRKMGLVVVPAAREAADG